MKIRWMCRPHSKSSWPAASSHYRQKLLAKAHQDRLDRQVLRDQQEDNARIETVAVDIQDVVNRQTCRPCFKMFGMCYNTTHSLCRKCYYATALIILESIS